LLTSDRAPLTEDRLVASPSFALKNVETIHAQSGIRTRYHSVWADLDCRLLTQQSTRNDQSH